MEIHLWEFLVLIYGKLGLKDKQQSKIVEINRLQSNMLNGKSVKTGEGDNSSKVSSRNDELVRVRIGKLGKVEQGKIRDDKYS
jgi:hypothetical protein